MHWPKGTCKVTQHEPLGAHYVFKGCHLLSAEGLTFMGAHSLSGRTDPLDHTAFIVHRIWVVNNCFVVKIECKPRLTHTLRGMYLAVILPQNTQLEDLSRGLETMLHEPLEEPNFNAEVA